MEYNFREIEQKWQEAWKNSEAYKVPNQSAKAKFYVLDMFPYPSGAGLHVGHPLGYIASDIYSRYKRLKGFNVLHPMGYDAFGLPAEQYAMEHGVHPAISTEQNIKNFRSQLDKIGFSYDWDREVKTCEPDYYKWTQWIFLQLFNSFYNRQSNKAEPIKSLVATFEQAGNSHHPFPNDKFQLEKISEDGSPTAAKLFDEKDWKSFDEKTQQGILMEYRLAYCGYGEVNWCEALGTVLANDEVVNGVSERGGHPVEKKRLRQWYLRITEYADRLLEGLDRVEFSESMKDMQSNWIGKSYGAEIEFLIPNPSPQVEKGASAQDASNKDTVFAQNGSSPNNAERQDNNNQKIEPNNVSATEAPLASWGEGLGVRVYTTRPDTIFGADFMVLAPELDYIKDIKTAAQSAEVDAYIAYVKSRSERERQAEKKISGCFTGAYAINPFDGREIPIWISEYVLAGYGTGAIMAVPCGDERDFKFAKHFGIPITNIIGTAFNGEEANATKDAILHNSDFLNGMVMRDAGEIVIRKIEESGIGKRKVNYKIRDAAFSRQRYWGEPFPIVWKDGVAYPLDESELPLELPEVESYSPGPEGEGPLANIPSWTSAPIPSLRRGGEMGAPAQNTVQNETWEGVGAALVPKYSVATYKQFEAARQMRKEQTAAEGMLWEALRNEKLGVKFRRQHPIESFIVDFVCLQKNLIVEVDGGNHEDEEQKIYDAERTIVLEEIGFKVIRFTNNQVSNNLVETLKEIKSALKNQNTTRAPLSTPGREAGSEGVRETNTMPGYAGSSWYFLRYMDPHNNTEFANRQVSDYWNQVDLYIGGTEHAVGHLLYSRLWTKALYDLGHIGFDEPFKKLLNQGMIQGSSRFVYRVHFLRVNHDLPDKTYQNAVTLFSETVFTNLFVSKKYYDLWLKNSSDSFVLNEVNRVFKTKDIEFNITIDEIVINSINVKVDLVDGFDLDIKKFRIWKPEYANASFILEDGTFVGSGAPLSTSGEGTGARYICGSEVEKMSKSKFNTVNPDDLVERYGADTFRMYEMFLGPVEQSKPWDTKGIEGVHRFLKKLWRLFYEDQKGLIVTNDAANAAELKALHKTIKKIEEDTERFSFNTAVSTFMIAVNELSDLKCHKKAVLEPLLVLLTPYAPHIAQELYNAMGNETGIIDAEFPKFDAAHVIESSKEYPVSINGKVRTTMQVSLDAEQNEVEQMVLNNELVQRWLEGKPLKKFIFVKGRMINLVV